MLLPKFARRLHLMLLMRPLLKTKSFPLLKPLLLPKFLLPKFLKPLALGMKPLPNSPRNLS
jgi:hypothetical protein